jgi:ParB-like nuclease domain
MKERTGHICEFPDADTGIAWITALERADISDRWERFWERLGKINGYNRLGGGGGGGGKRGCPRCFRPVPVKQMFTGGHLTGACRALPLWLRRYYRDKRREKIMQIKFEDFKPAYPELLPALTAEEFGALKDDIKLRGVLVAIEIDVATNEIVDGYHRHKAAVELGMDKVPMTTRQFKSEVERKLHALSLNVHRRQLTLSQRAAFAAELLPLFEKHAKERQLANLRKGTSKPVRKKVPPQEKGKATDQAAKVLKVNAKYVSDAKRIKEESPEKFEEIKAGKKSISEVRAEMKPHAANGNGNGGKLDLDGIARHAISLLKRELDGATDRDIGIVLASIVAALGVSRKTLQEFLFVQ